MILTIVIIVIIFFLLVPTPEIDNGDYDEDPRGY